VNTSRPPTTATDLPRRLVDVLRALPTSELDGLVSRLGIRIDAQKRIDVPGQVARSLVALPEVRDPGLLPPASGELLHRIAESRGLLKTASLPQAVEPLSARGIVFARLGSPGVELILPTAFLVQLRAWEGEDPRGVRALLAQASFETCSAIASHYLGRPATPPLALALEPAWEVLSDPARLTEEIERLAPPERRLLEAVEREGGEVVTEELLDLEREPMRLRSAMGATPSRRGAGFALERRGLLIPIHPNRHVIPTEVSAVVAADGQKERELRRAQVKASVLGGDYAPRRARFAEDPAPLALAMSLAVRETASEIRPTVGTPRSLTTKLSQRFGRDADRVMLIGALSRAAGLWDPSALSAAAPPGSWTIQEITRALFRVWRRGGAWDEARPHPEVYRLAHDARDASPVGLLKEMIIDALRELGEGRWVPWNALAGYVRDDARTPGLARLFRRWAERAGLEAPSPLDIVRRIAFESLPALGVLDLGDAESEDEVGPAMRLTPRGRALLAGTAFAAPAASEFTAADTLVLGGGANVSAVLGVSAFVDIGKVGDQLELSVTSSAIGRALSAGLEADVVRARLEALAPLHEDVARLLQQAGKVLATVHLVPCSGYLTVEDASVREMLLTRRQTMDLFVDGSPSGGLLVASGADVDRLVRRCRALGVEIVQDGQVLRARSTTPPLGMPAAGERRKSSSSSLKRSGG
jgi:hypothetical protein